MRYSWLKILAVICVVCANAKAEEPDPFNRHAAEISVNPFDSTYQAKHSKASKENLVDQGVRWIKSGFDVDQVNVLGTRLSVKPEYMKLSDNPSVGVKVTLRW